MNKTEFWRCWGLACLVVGLLGIPRSGFSHEGAEHSHEVPVRSQAPIEQSREITHSHFELVIKPATWPADQLQKVRLFLADYNSNAPLQNARIQIEWQPQYTTQPSQVAAGIYETTVKLSAGQYNPVVSIAASNQKADLLWDELTIVSAPAPQHPPTTQAHWLIWVAGGTFLAIGIWGWKNRHRVGKPV